MGEGLAMKCEECKYCSWDCAEGFNGLKQWFQDGCKKDLVPVYNEEEEVWECEGYYPCDEQ